MASTLLFPCNIRDAGAWKQERVVERRPRLAHSARVFGGRRHAREPLELAPQLQKRDPTCGRRRRAACGLAPLRARAATIGESKMYVGGASQIVRRIRTKSNGSKYVWLRLELDVPAIADI